MAEESGASRMRALLSKFEPIKEEPPPPPPSKERFQSALDAPRPTLSSEAKSARVQSLRASTVTDDTKPRRSIPQIGPSDTDEERELKRQIQAKEQEIMDVASKLSQITERLDRALNTFNASIIATNHAAEAAPSENRTRAFGEGESKAEVGEVTSRKSAPASSGTSLEAILAAARGGGGGRVKSETPKYAKLLRDLK